MRKQMIKDNFPKPAWTPQEEEIIQFFMGLIPILQEVKVDLESKKLLPKSNNPAIWQNI
jgi:hypothetical protein